MTMTMDVTLKIILIMHLMKSTTTTTTTTTTATTKQVFHATLKIFVESQL